MKKTRIIHVILILLFVILNYQCEREWVNPYDSQTEATIGIYGIGIETLSPDSVRISWDNNLEGVILDKKTNDDPWITEYAVIRDALSFIDTKLDVKTNTYTYRLYAFAGLNRSAPETVVYDFACGYDSVSDPRDGTVYSTIQINKQCWFKENLSYLPEVFPPTDVSAGVSRYYVYGYQGANTNEAIATENYNSYGALYNWQASIHACPESLGWEASTPFDWYALINLSGGYGVAGSVLKEVGSLHWKPSNTIATNFFDFTALPGGMLKADSGFVNKNTWGYFLGSRAEPQFPNLNEGDVFGMKAENGAIQKSEIYLENAYSIRCIKR